MVNLVKAEYISNVLGIFSLHCWLLQSEQSFMMGVAAVCETGPYRLDMAHCLRCLHCRTQYMCFLSYRENVQQTCNRLWPQRQEECIRVLRARDARGREDRKQRIQEKQSQIIEEFAYLRRQFMEKAMKTGTVLGR